MAEFWQRGLPALPGWWTGASLGAHQPEFPMTRHRRLAALLPLLFAGPALAQAPAPAAPPVRPVTVWEDVAEPMSTLLNGGHRIVSSMGPAFTLERNGKYIACEVRPAGGMRGTRETTSECHRLN
jgi:hypothetical protein